MFSEDIRVYDSFIFGNTPWKLQMRGVCIGRRQWQHCASDRTQNSSEPQICTGGFSTVMWLRLDAKIVDKHKMCKQLLSSACLDATGSSNGAYPVRLYHDVNEETAGWAHQVDIRSDIERESFLTDHFFDYIWKDMLFVMGNAFVYITLWYTNTTPGVLLCGVPTVLIPCRSHQTRW